MKKAVIIGGSNGIGLAIGNILMTKGYYLNVLDCSEPDKSLMKFEQYEYRKCDLLDFDENLIAEMVLDHEIEVLMITSGIGRIANFEYLHISEIEKLLTINLVSTLKILRMFYERIKNQNTFYVGVMGSIAGLISSPMFSVYAASKAGICRFIESINVELEANGYDNRILNVSPGSIKGTKFNGGENDLSQTINLAEQIIEHLYNRDELFIPEYNEIYQNVLDRYHTDPHEYGLHSYVYKMNSGRTCNERKVKIGYLSGTFDLFHVGHLNLLRRAKQQCDYLIVGVHNSGAWKGKETFIPIDERKEIVSACKYVDKVVDSCSEDCDAWDLWHYDRLFVGSDYKGTERFNKYEQYFKDKGVEIIYFPYTKTTSSTQIRKTVSLKIKDV